MDKERVLSLAKLSRIEISDEEAQTLSSQFDSILNYVGEVKKVPTTDNLQPTAESFTIRNVFREDGEPHKSGIYTEDVLREAPAKKGSYIKVKKIL